jgi:hypothetical protein
MTDEEKNLYYAICDVRNKLAEQTLNTRRLLNDIEAVVEKALIYLIYNGKGE